MDLWENVYNMANGTSSFRTDRNNNPTAITTDIAHQGGLIQNTDYVQGDPFTVNNPRDPSSPLTYYTAKLLGDPVALTIKVINNIDFYTRAGVQRWIYIGMPTFVWEALTPEQQRDVIGWMYGKEGGTSMRPLFPNYGKL
jgi:hypothetical protein